VFLRKSGQSFLQKSVVEYMENNDVAAVFMPGLNFDDIGGILGI